MNVPITAESLVNAFQGSDQSAAKIAVLADGSYVIVWQSTGQDGSQIGLVAQKFSAQGQRIGTPVIVNQTAENTQQEPAIAATEDGGFVVVWEALNQDVPGSNDFGVIGRRFDADMAPLGDEFVVNTVNTSFSQFDPDVAAVPGGGFAVTYTDDLGDGGSDGIRIRFYDAAGVPLADDVQVNTGTSGNQAGPAIATIRPDAGSDSLANGGLVVVWDGPGDGNSDGVFAQIYAPDGSAIGGEFQVNTQTAGSQRDADVIGLTNGRFVVVWQDNSGADGSGLGIFAQVYEGNGTTVGTEFQVNIETSSTQSDPAVAATADGGFVITWTSVNSGTAGDGNSDGVISRRFDADGIAVTGEEIVNQTTLGSQFQSDVAGLGDGNFVAVWTGPDADGNGVYQRIAGDPASFVAPSASPEVEAISANRIFAENTVNAAPQRLDIDGAAAVSDADSADFDGGRLTVSRLSQSIVEDDFANQDADGQDAFGIDATGRVAVSGTQVSVDGTVIGSIGSDGSGGQPLVIDLTAGATPEAVEVLVEHLTYQNLSDDPRGQLQVIVQLEDGDGGASTPAIVNIEITPEPDTDGRVRGEVRVNTFRTDNQEFADVASTFDPATGAINGYVVVWQSRNQDNPGDNSLGVFGQRYDADGAPVGAEFQINQTVGQSQFDAHVAGLNDGGFVVVWTDDNGDASGAGIRLTRYDANGVPVAGQTEITVNTEISSTQSQPRVTALSDGGYQVLWTSFASGTAGDGSSNGVITQRFNAADQRVGGEQIVNEQTAGQQDTAQISALADGRFVAVWESQTNGASGDGSGNGVFARLFDDTGVPEGSEFQVNTFTAGEQTLPVVATLTGGDFVVAWISASQDGSSNGIYAQRFTAAGVPVGDEFRVNDVTAGNQTDPAITALDDGRFVISWTDTSTPAPGQFDDVFAQVFDADGTRLDSQVLVNSDVTNTQDESALAALPGGNFVVVWTSNGDASTGFGNEIQSQIFGDPADFTLSAPPQIEGLAPAITLGETAANAGALLAPAGALTLTDPDSADFDGGSLRITRFATDPDGDDFAAPDDASQDNLSFAGGGRVALSGSDVLVDGVVIGTLTATGQNGADLAVDFNADATVDRVEALLRTLTYTNDSDNPRTDRSFSLQLTDGDGSVQNPQSFTVSLVQEPDSGVIAPVGTEQQVNTFAANAQSDPEVAVLADGGWVVVWSSDTQDFSDTGIFAQRYNADGTRNGAEFQVHTTETGAQADPVIAGLSNGGFVIAWEGPFVDAPGVNDRGVLAQIYNADGSAAGGELVLNSLTLQSQFDVAIAADPSGGFVAAWTSDNGDSSGQGIRYNRFDNAGTPVGTEITVNTGAEAGSQFSADLAVLANGNALVVWQANSGGANDGSGSGLFGRIVDGAGAFVSGIFPINQVTQSDQSEVEVVATASGFVAVWTDSSGQDSSGAGVQARFFDQSGNPLGDEFTVNEERASTQSAPSVDVLDDGRVLIAWQTQDAPGGSGADVSGQLFRPTGERIDGEFRINTEISSSQIAPKVAALPGNNFVTVWESSTSGTAGDGSNSGIFQQIFGDPGDFSANVADAIVGLPASVAFDEADVNAALQRIDPDKTAAVPPLGDDNFDGGVLTIAIDNLDPAVAQLGDSDNAGQHQIGVLTGDVGNGDVTLAGANVLVDGVTVGEITSDGSNGQPLAIKFNAAADAEAVEAVLGNVGYANISNDPANIRLAVDLTSGSGVSARTSFIEVAIADETDLALVAGAERRVNAHTQQTQDTPEIVALTGGGYVVVWESTSQDELPTNSFDLGVFAQVYDGAGVPVGPEIRVNTTIAATQRQPDVAATADGGFVVVWEGDFQDDPGLNDVGIIAQRFNADGSLNGGEIVVNTTVQQTQFDPSVSGFADGGFVVSYTSDNGDDSNDAILSQRVDASGALLGEVVVNTTTPGNQSRSDVATLTNPVTGANAGHVVTWTDPSEDGSGSSVRGRLFDAAGTALGPDFRVSTTTEGDQFAPSAAGLADGGFVIAWMDDRNDGSSTGVFAQRYDASGTAIGGEFRVNETVSSQQSEPSVGALASGGFVITWEGIGAGDNSGVFAQVFDAAGARVDGEQLVNVETSSSQFQSAVTGLATGGFAVAFTSVTSGPAGDGAGNGVFLRSFEPVQPVTNAPVLTDVARIVTLGAVDVTSGPVVLDDGVAFSDPDNTDFNGGTLLAYYTSQSLATDGLVIANQGGVTVSGASVSLGGTVVGTIDATEDGSAGASLLVTFNANADAAAVKAVFEALAFTSSDSATNIQNTDRGIGFLITDGNGGQTEPDSIFLDINAGTVSPSGLAISDFGVAENENASILGRVLASELLAAPRLLDADVDLDDFAGTSFNGGVLQVNPSSNRQQTLSVEDQGTGSGQIGFDGTTVTFEGTAIGTLDATRTGQNGAAFEIDLNAAATAEAVEALAEAITVQLDNGVVGTFSSFQLFVRNQAGNTAQSSFTSLEITNDIVEVNALPADTPEEQVNTFANDDQESPRIAALADGGYVVVWTSRGQDNPADNSRGIFAQRYNEFGQQVGVEFQVNDLSQGDQIQPRVAALSTGDFIVAWTETNSRDSSGNGVFAQRFNADGTRDGATFLVNETVSGNQDSAQIADLGGGRSLLVWVDQTSDGSGPGIFGRVFDASGQPEGGEFQINTTTSSTQNRPRVTELEDGDVLVTWQSASGDGSSTGVFAQRIDASGDLVGFDGATLTGGVTSDERQINTTTTGAQDRPDVAALSPSATLPNGGFAVVWQSPDASSTGIFAQVFDIDGSAVGGEVQLNLLASGFQGDPVPIGTPDGNFVVVWRDDSGSDGNGTGVTGQRVNADGTLDGLPFIVNSETASTQDQPEIAALDNGSLVAVWRTFAGLDGSVFGVSQRVIDPAPLPAGAMAPVLAGFETAAVLDEADVNLGLQLVDADGVISLTDMDSADFDGGSLIVARVVGSANIFDGQLGDQDGLAQEVLGIVDGNGVAVSGTTVSVDGTAIGTVVQDGKGGTPLEIVFNASSTPEAVEQVLARLGYANTSDDPAPSRQFAVQVSDGDGGSTGSRLLTVDVVPSTDRPQEAIGADEQVNSFTSGDQTAPASATLFDPGTGQPAGYVTVWQGQAQDRPQDSGTGGVFAQIFDLDGEPVGGEFQINSHTEFSQTAPTVVGLAGGGFVVAWQDDSFANPAGLPLGEASDGVYGRVFGNDGQPAGGDFLINEQTNSTQNQPSLAALADGGFAAIWTSANSAPAGDGNSNGVFARTFNADGTARGGEFGVNQTTLSAQSQGDVTQLANGNLAFVWTSFGQDAANTNGIFARITSATGADVVAEFQVNASASGSQLSPRIEALDGGGFVAVWQDDSGLDGASSGIFQQRFADDGTPTGVETRVNGLTNGTQSDPDIAALPGGGWVVAWTDSGNDGSGQGVFAQVYGADGSRLDGQFQVNAETASTQSGPTVTAIDGQNFAISFNSFTSGTSGDGDRFGVFQQVFAVPGTLADSADPVVVGVAEDLAFGEGALNAAPQLLFPNVAVGDADSGTLSGGRLTLTMLENALVQDQFGSPDNGTQDQLSILAGGGITVTGAQVRLNGTVIGTIVEDGADGAPLAIALNGNADPAAVETLIERLAYANTSDDPAGTRQITLTLTDGDGGSLRTLTTVTIEPEADAGVPVDDEVLTNSFTEDTQQEPAIAAVVDPATGLPDGYVVVWQSNNQDATGDNRAGVFGQLYDVSGAPVGGEFQVNTITSFDQFAPSVTGLATGGFAVTWQDNSATDKSGSQVYAQVFDGNAQPVGGEIFVDSSGFSQASPSIASFANGDFVIVRAAQDDQSPSQNTIVGQRFSDSGGTVGLEFEIEDLANTAFNNPDVAVLSDGKMIVVFEASGFEADSSGIASGNGVFGQLFAPDGSAIAGTFQINTRERFNQDNARVAATDDGGFVVVYESDFNDDFGFTTSPGIYAQRFDTNGNPVGDEILVNEVVDASQLLPDVVGQPGGGFTVVFADNIGTDGSGVGVFSQTYDANGARVDGQTQVNQEGLGTQTAPAIAALGNGNFVVAYQSSVIDGSSNGIAHRIFGDPDDFAAVGDPVVDGVNRTVTYSENLLNGIPQLIDANGAAAVSDSDSANFDGGSLLVSNVISSAPLIDQINAPDDLTQDILGLRQGPRIAITGDDVSVDGTVVGNIVQDGSAGRPFEIALNANATPEATEVLVENLTYRNVSDDPLELRQLRIQLTDGDGGAADPVLVTVNITPTVDAAVPLGGERQANTETANAQDTPAIATLANGDFVIVWESAGQDGSSDGVFAQRFDAFGNPTARDGTPLASGLTDEFQVNTTTDFSQFDAAVVGLPDGGFVVSWTDTGGLDGSGRGVFAQRYDAAGAEVAPDGGALGGTPGEFQVNVQTSSSQDQSDVAALQGVNAGSFVAVWHSETSAGAGDGSGSGIIGRVFTPAGQSEFVVNAEIRSEQDEPQIIALSDGGFYVVWQSFSTTFESGVGTIPPTADGDRNGIFAQRFDATFAPVGGEIQINQRTSDDQFEPQVAALEGGNLVVTWTNDNADGSGNGIFAQIVDPDGNAVTQEFRVNDQRIGAQQKPDVTALDTGGFVIVWHDNNGTDGSGFGVFAQQYDAAGNRIDSQFQVNTETSGSQFEPVVTALSDGGFAIAWTSGTSATAGDGSSNGVFYQVFANAAPQVADVEAIGDEDVPIVLGAEIFESGFVDPDGQTLQAIRIATLPAQGNLTLNGNPVTPGQEIQIADLQAGNLVYLGNQDFNGLDGFEWTGSDGISFADQLVRADITVRPVNDAPGLEAGPDATVAEGENFARTLTLSDPDNDNRTFTVDFGDGSAVQTFNSPNITPTIAHQYASEGAFTVTVTVDDNAGEANSVETDSFVVTVQNAPPQAGNDFRTVSEDSTGTNLGSPLVNDFDPGLDPITLVEFAGVSETDAAFLDTPVTLASGAEVTLTNSGEFIYNPNGQFESFSAFQNGQDSFTYTIRDSDGATDIGTVFITIDGQNDAPVAADDDLVANSDTPISANVLADNGNGPDSDVDNGATLTVVALNGDPAGIGGAVVLPSGATVTLLADGSLDYDPRTLASAIAVDTFTYTIADEFGAESTAEVNIAINQSNLPPVARDDTVTVSEDAALIGGDLFADNGNGVDTDPDGDAIAVSQVEGAAGNVGSQIALASGALLTVNADGSFDYDPNGQFETLAASDTGTDTFTYRITDGNGGTDDATVTVEIDGQNDAPVAGSINDAAVEDGPAATGNLLANSSDIDAGTVLSIAEINGSALVLNVPLTLASGAILTVQSNGDYTYDPAGGFQTLGEGASSSETIGFTVQDGDGGTDTATLFVAITGANDAPDARDDDFTVGEGFILTEDAFDNNGAGADLDIDIGDSFQVIEVNGAAAGVGTTVTLASGALLTMNASGTFTYDQAGSFEFLDTGQSGLDSFTYTISDGLGGTDQATVSITIDGDADRPVALDDDFTTGENQPLSGDVLADNGNGADFDPDIEALTVTELNGVRTAIGVPVTLASGAQVVLNADGTFDYDPLAAFDSLGVGQTGTDSFTYTVADRFDLNDTATVTITLTGENDAPVARNDAFGIGEDQALLQDNVLANNGFGADSDVDQTDTLTVIAVNGQAANVGARLQLASGAFLTVGADGGFDFETNGAFEFLSLGTEQTEIFTYTISDGNGATASATAGITVSGANDAPVAVDDSFQVVVDRTFDGNVITGVNSLPDSDVDQDDVLSVIALNGASAAIGVATVLASGATVTLNPDGTFTYDPTTASFDPPPALGSPVTDSFDYTLSDGVNGTDTGTVTVTVQPVGFDNNPPVPAAISVTFGEDDALLDVDLLDGAFDADGDDLDVLNPLIVSSGGRSVAFSLDGETGLLSLTPGQFEDLDDGETETLTVTFDVTDGVEAVLATATVSILGANDAPVAVADTVTVAEDSATTSIDVLANDFDVDGDALQVDATTLPANGVIGVFGDRIEYTPNADFNGVDSFTYRVFDGTALSEFTTVTVVVTPVEDLPEAEDDSFTVAEDAVLTGDVSLNDSDRDGDTLSYAVLADVSNGTLVLDTDGSFTYTPDPDFNGTDSFTYEVSDGDDTTTATATITVNAVNDAPVAEDDSFTVAEDSLSNVLDVLGNDLDVDGDIVLIETTTAPSNGTIEVFSDRIEYTPDAGFAGTDSFTYRISDGTALSGFATVNVTVLAGDDLPPVIAPIAAEFGEDDAVLAVDLLEGAADPEGADLDVLDLSVVSSLGRAVDFDVDGESGILTIAPGQFEDLAEGAVEELSLAFTVTDGVNAVANTGLVTITGVNDAPVVLAEAEAAFGEDDTRLLITQADLVNAAVVTDVDNDLADLFATALTCCPNIAIDGVAVDLDIEILSTVDGPDTVWEIAPGQFDFLREGQLLTFDAEYLISDGIDEVKNIVSVTITGVNDAPVALAGAAFAFSEDDDPVVIGAADLINAATFTDADDDLGDLRLTALTCCFDVAGDEVLVDGDFDPVAQSFTLVPGQFEDLAEGEVRVLTLTYSVTDGQSDPVENVATLTILGQNDAPDILSDVFDVVENTTAVGTVLAQDVDGDDLSFAIAGGADEGLFAIDATSGALSFTAAPDFEAPGDADGDNVYEVAVAVSDGLVEVTRTLSVTVLDDPADNGQELVVEGTPGSDQLRGTAADETIRSLGGAVDLVFGGGGADTFEFGEELSNGVREVDYIADWSADDRLDLGGATIQQEIAIEGAVYLFVSGDSDLIVLLGPNGFDADTQLI